MTKLQAIRLCVLLLSSLLVFSCGDNGVYPPKNEDGKDKNSLSMKEIEGVEWRLYSLEGQKPNPIVVPANQVFTIVFRDKEATGRADLNTYAAKYDTAANRTLHFSEFIATNNPARTGGLEPGFFEAMHLATKFEATDSTLRILNTDGSKILNFRKYIPINFLSRDAIAGKQWRLRSFEGIDVWNGGPSTFTVVPNNQIITLSVNADGVATGRVDRNAYRVTFVIPKPTDEVNYQSRSTSELFYLEPRVAPGNDNGLEDIYMSALGIATYYSVTDTSLMIYYQGDNNIMHFTLDNTSYEEKTSFKSFVGTNWQLVQMWVGQTQIELPIFPVTLFVEPPLLWGKDNCNRHYSIRFKEYPWNHIATYDPKINIEGCESTGSHNDFMERYREALMDALSYEIVDDNRLTIYTAYNKHKLVYERVN